MVEPGLRDKTVKGVGWSAADAFLSQGVTFLVGLVLARLLTPDEYGLIGIVTIFTSVLLGIVDSGFSNAIIRKQNVTEEDYSTLFVFNLIISILLFFLLYFFAPIIASFFGRSQLVSLVRVMGLILIIQALSIVHYTILSRRIDFKTKTKANVTAAIVSGCVGIFMAFSGFGVWSLVGLHLSRQFIYSLCLWLFNKWWPKLIVNISSLKYMWGFGWKLMLSGVINNVWNNLYQVVVGRFYSPATLGQYTQANDYASIFSSSLTNIVQRVSYPVLSQVQNEHDRLISGYRRIIKTTMYVTAVVLFFMGAISEPLIYCLIGEQWLEAASYLPLICVFMSLYPLHAINLNMLQVQGRTDIFLYLEILKKIIGVIPLAIGIFVSIYWMLIGSIVTGVISFFLNSYYTGKKMGYSSWMQIKDVLPSYGIACAVAISVFFLKFLPFSYWIILPLQIVLGFAVLFFLSKTTKMPEYIEITSIAKDYYSKFFHK